MLMEYTMFVLNKPNKNGIIYTKESIENALKKLGIKYRIENDKVISEIDVDIRITL